MILPSSICFQCCVCHVCEQRSHIGRWECLSEALIFQKPWHRQSAGSFIASSMRTVPPLRREKKIILMNDQNSKNNNVLVFWESRTVQKHLGKNIASQVLESECSVLCILNHTWWGKGRDTLLTPPASSCAFLLTSLCLTVHQRLHCQVANHPQLFLY